MESRQEINDTFDPNSTPGDMILSQYQKVAGSRFFRGWNELKVSGKLPERRSYHVAYMVNGYMYVFGG
jgi:hypothetical protein